METGTILAWLKSRGDTVRKGEPLLEVETDKGTAVAEATMSGTLTERVTVACDHRAAYCAAAARFLQRLRELLETSTCLVSPE
jgi:pyruvate/2-oxoglutarate dehydrogenase complex dihydrolipoamide acyltransferase (E2) component